MKKSLEGLQSMGTLGEQSCGQVKQTEGRSKQIRVGLQLLYYPAACGVA